MQASHNVSLRTVTGEDMTSQSLQLSEKVNASDETMSGQGQGSQSRQTAFYEDMYANVTSYFSPLLSTLGGGAGVFEFRTFPFHELQNSLLAQHKRDRVQARLAPTVCHGHVMPRAGTAGPRTKEPLWRCGPALCLCLFTALSRRGARGLRLSGPELVLSLIHI